MKTPLLPWRKSGRINVVLVGFGEPTGSDEEASDQDSSAQAHSSILSLIRNRHSRLGLVCRAFAGGIKKPPKLRGDPLDRAPHAESRHDRKGSSASCWDRLAIRYGTHGSSEQVKRGVRKDGPKGFFAFRKTGSGK